MQSYDFFSTLTSKYKVFHLAQTKHILKHEANAFFK